MSDTSPLDMRLVALRQAYQNHTLTPAQVMANIRQRASLFEDRNIWIHLLTESEVAPFINGLADKPIADYPLWGIPFAIKDNIDLAGITTTAGCEAFAKIPHESAFAVQRLLDAGAIPVGKTNLDQLATGLNGTRSPWGPGRNAFDPEYISGGSSAGSATAVALGLASFSLGSDTAGSGRVPAGFNNLVGLKPSRGLLSASGMVPACRSLDCISIFALTSEDANQVLARAEGFDPRDGYSRQNNFANSSRRFGLREGPIKLGVLPESQLRFFGEELYAQAYNATIETLRKAGVELIEIDYSPFNEAALLLYEGPWVSERYIAAQPIIEDTPEALLPVIRAIIEPGGARSATDLFRAQYRLQELKLACEAQLQGFDALLTPTVGKHFTVEELQQEPIRYNSDLGYYTNFVNLMDMAAVAVPTGFTTADMPFGVTLVGPALSDRTLLSMAQKIETLCPRNRLGTLPFSVGEPNLAIGNKTVIELAVCGAHLEGLPLNWQLTERGARLKTRTYTSEDYRLYALAGGPPHRPGLIRDSANGQAIAVEVWQIPAEEFGSFVADIPAPLGIGKVELADGRWISSFICEPYGIEGATEITALGGWRAYLAQP